MLTSDDMVHETLLTTRADGARRRPYAGPAGRPAVGIAMPRGPYRSRQAGGTSAAVAEGPTPSLPWIDQFLASTPAASVVAVAPPVESTVMAPMAEPAAEPGAEPVAELLVESVAEPMAESVAESMPTATTEPWPLEEASARLAELRPALARLDADAARPDHLFAEPAPVDALPPWSDDDFIDIMPTLDSMRHDALGSSPRRESPPRGEASVGSSSEIVALALEALALRVRRGELTLPGYDPALGDSAVLVAALAALHGVR